MSKDDQFRQWAKAAYRKMYDLYGYIDTDSESAYVDVLARAAYDLVEHVINHAPASVSDADDWEIPDMPVLPEEDAE